MERGGGGGAFGNEAGTSNNFLRIARGGNVKKVAEFLDAGANVNASNANGLSALHLASKEGHAVVVRELLRRGAAVNASTKKGNTALHIASLAGHSAVAQALLQGGAAPNAQSGNGFTPLYMAAQENHLQLVQLLLEAGADPQLATTDGFTPLAVALQQGHERVVTALLERDTSSRCRLPALHAAAKRDDAKAAGLLLLAGAADVEIEADAQAGSGFTALHVAAHYGSNNVAQLLLQRGASANFAASSSVSPLHVAAKWGHSGVAQLLLQHKADVDCRTKDALTPLHCAARAGHLQLLQLLLRNGADIEARSRSGLTPLHTAAQGDKPDCVLALVQQGASVEAMTVDSLTPLHVAAHCGSYEAAAALVELGAEGLHESCGFSPLHVAAKKNRARVVELLIRRGVGLGLDGVDTLAAATGGAALHAAAWANASAAIVSLLGMGRADPNLLSLRGETPLHVSARRGTVEAAASLLRAGADVDAVDSETAATPLHFACREGHQEVVLLLLRAGASPAAVCRPHNATPLHVAAANGREQLARVLLDQGAPLHPITRSGATPLHAAARGGHRQVVRLLLAAGADSNRRAVGGATPLHAASRRNHPEVVQALLRAGASADTAAGDGTTPLHAAAGAGHHEVVRVLLEAGAGAAAVTAGGLLPLHLAAMGNHPSVCQLLLQQQQHRQLVDATDAEGSTALHLCAQRGCYPVAEALILKNGAQVEPLDERGCTPLHTACYFGREAIVQLLLQQGANVAAMGPRGFTPLHLAAQQGHLGIVKLLLLAAADPYKCNQSGRTASQLASRRQHSEIVAILAEAAPSLASTSEFASTLSLPTSGDAAARGERSGLEMAEREQDEELAEDTAEQQVQSEQQQEVPQSPLYARRGHVQLGAELGPVIPAVEAVISAQVSQSVQSSAVPPAGAAAGQRLPRNYIVVKETPPALRQPRKDTFQSSFLADARGADMTNSRQPQQQVQVSPGAVQGPTRITCRQVVAERVARPPQLCDGEGMARQIVQVESSDRLRLPLRLRLPHSASLRHRHRELLLLVFESNVWKEVRVAAPQEVTDLQSLTMTTMLQSSAGSSSSNSSSSSSSSSNIIDVLVPVQQQLLSVVTRVRQETALVGPEGGSIESTVVPGARAQFPEGALTKKIRVGMQVLPVSQEVTQRLLGVSAVSSAVLTIEPRRRKFHQPIILSIPLSAAATQLRLLCSIAGGSQPAVWEDISGSTALQRDPTTGCVSFTTTVSARFWLLQCEGSPAAVSELAGRIYREAAAVPYTATAFVFAARIAADTADVTVTCVTEAVNASHSLETLRSQIEVGQSEPMEIVEAKRLWLRFHGNLAPAESVSQEDDQHLCLSTRPFRVNRLSFRVRLLNTADSPEGRIDLFVRPALERGDTPLASVSFRLPDLDGPLAQDPNQQPDTLASAADGEAARRQNEEVDRDLTPTPEIGSTPEQQQQHQAPRPWRESSASSIGAGCSVVDGDSSCDENSATAAAVGGGAVGKPRWRNSSGSSISGFGRETVEVRDSSSDQETPSLSMNASSVAGGEDLRHVSRRPRRIQRRIAMMHDASGDAASDTDEDQYSAEQSQTG